MIRLKIFSGCLKTAAVLYLSVCCAAARADTLLAQAEDGDTEAMFALAQRLSLPEHGGDIVEAAKWYEAAAQADHAPSVLQMGHFYQNGTAVPANAKVAQVYFCKAGELFPAGSAGRREAKTLCKD